MDGGGYCIGYARSSHALTSTDPSPIAFVALGGDAITWSSPEGNGVTSPVPATLTLAQLKAIYLCTDTNRDQASGSSAPIVAVLPQDGFRDAGDLPARARRRHHAGRGRLRQDAPHDQGEGDRPRIRRPDRAVTVQL